MAGSSRRPTKQQQAAARRRQEQQRVRWEEQERKRVTREMAEQERLAARQAREDEQNRMLALAVEKTETVERYVAEVTGIIAGALRRKVGPYDFDRMKQRAEVEPLELGEDERPLLPPRWEQFAPRPPGKFGKALGGQARYDTLREAAERDFEQAMQSHRAAEASRQRRVVAARERHAAKLAEMRRRLSGQHAQVDEFRRKVLDGDRHAVSGYFQRVLDEVRVPAGFPRGRRAAYVPESTLLVVEWSLPGTNVIPVEKEFGFIKSRNVIEVRKTRSAAELRAIY